jgi:hypothetical protein
MSSTNRKDAAERHVSDYYVTPVSEVEKFLAALYWHRGVLGPLPQENSLKILDPCAGGDVEHAMSYPAALANSDWTPYISLLDTIDVREDSLASIKGDFLTMPTEQLNAPYDIVMSNPPFNIALDFIQKSLTLVRPGGLVIMLLRLNFFGTKTRNEWLRANMPLLTYVHAKRMSFGKSKHGKAATDSVEYMHAVWQAGEHPPFSGLQVLLHD